MKMNLDEAGSYTLMYFDFPALELIMPECLATAYGHKVEYPISGDALARIRAKS